MELNNKKCIDLNQIINELIEDIAFYRDLNNDFPNRDYENELINTLEKEALKLFKIASALKEGYEKVKVAVIGNFSSGKSTFINSILGKSICPMHVNPTTSTVTKFVYGEEEEIYIIKDSERKKISKEEYFNLVQHKIGKVKSKKFYKFEYKYPSDVLRNIELYDTPGFENPKNPNDDIITNDVLQNEADVVLFIQDINQPVIEDRIRAKIEKVKSNKPNMQWFLILNKADLKSKDAINKIIKELEKDKFIKSVFKDIFIYSAEKIRKYLEEDSLNEQRFIENVLNAIKREINTLKLSKNRNASYSSKVEISIECNKPGRRGCSGNYEIKLNGQRIAIISGHNSEVEDYLKVRDKLLEVIKQISVNRYKILMYKFEKCLGEYINTRKTILDKIMIEIMNELEASENGDNNLIILGRIGAELDRIRKLIFDNYENFDEYIRNIIYSNVKVYEIEGSGIFINDGAIEINGEKISNEILDLIKGILQKVEVNFKGLSPEIYNKIEKRLKEKFETILYLIETSLNQYLSNIKEHFGKRRFSNIDEAEKVREEIVVDMTMSIIFMMKGLLDFFYWSMRDTLSELYNLEYYKNNIERERKNQIVEKLKIFLQDKQKNTILGKLIESDDTYRYRGLIDSIFGETKQDVGNYERTRNFHIAQLFVLAKFILFTLGILFFVWMIFQTLSF
jgi:ribosome biogenesis GTPase A